MKREDIEKAAEEYEDSLTYTSIKEQCDSEKTNQYKSILPLVDQYLDDDKEDNDGCAVGMGIALAAIVAILYIIYATI